MNRDEEIRRSVSELVEALQSTDEVTTIRVSIDPDDFDVDELRDDDED